MTRPRQNPSAGFLWALAVLLAIGHALLAVTATAGKSVTADEIAHVVAGHSYNIRHDFRLQPENGNLPQRWAALPLSLAHASLPPEDTASWRRGDVWKYSHQVFYREGLSTDELLFEARATVALFSAATALLVFAWSRRLFGWRGAFLSLSLYCLAPEFLAHGSLATSDLVMTFFFLAATGAWWRQLQKPGLVSCGLSALAFGLACVAKYSAVLLLPIFGLCAVIWLVSAHASLDWRARWRWLAASTAVHVVTAWAVIWLFYGLRFSAFSSEAPAAAQFYRGGWEWILDGLGWPRVLIVALRNRHVLPEAFLYGFTFVVQFSRERAAFLNGDYSVTGWTVFFPYAFAVKSTLPFLLTLVFAAVVQLRRIRLKTQGVTRSTLLSLTPLAVLLVVYSVSSLTSHLNIGHRHLLPIYPVLFIAAGSLGMTLDRRHVVTLGVVVTLLTWHAVESFAVRPHYLAYFNELVGGPRQGWRHLVDSSLDWGQDLPGLKRWLDENTRYERVYLSYFGTGDPEYEGIRATLLPRVPDLGAPRPRHSLTAGVYAISATMLQHDYSDIRGPWTLALEREYQQLRPREAGLISASARRDVPPENGDKIWRRYEDLRFARLCHVLRAREPVANVGYSILIYRLTDQDIHAAIGSTYSEWRDARDGALAR